RRNASTRCTGTGTPLRKPTTGIAGCCARAASGHAAAALPTSVMNSRRLIVAPRGQNHARHRLTAVRVLEPGEGDANCDQLFWSGMSALGPTTGSKPEKLSISKCFSVLPPKAELPPDLRTTPCRQVLAKRRHRGLARRLVVVRRRAVLMMAKGERPQPRRSVPERLHVLAG